MEVEFYPGQEIDLTATVHHTSALKLTESIEAKLYVDLFGNVGQLYEDSGTVKHENTMLHFEKYSNEAECAFTNTSNVNDYWNVKDKSASKPFYRREDLENPTEFLDKCE